MMSRIENLSLWRSLARQRALVALAGALVALAGCSGGSSGGGGGSAGGGSAGVAGAASQPLPALTPLPAGQQPSMTDAARFLSQASFGPRSDADVSNVQQGGYDAWLAQQFSIAPVSQMGYLNAAAATQQNGNVTEEMSYEAIWQQWLHGSDQLRQRVAFALSEIFVISNVAPNLDPRGMTSYMDMLEADAFGNYRQLLQDVTLHPVMGSYLNMLRSQKDNSAGTIHPNENYAREVLQLFSIGLVALNPDGSVQTSAGQPVPTYDQSVVQGFAQAFTGWSFAGGDTTSASSFYNGNVNWTQPMQAWPGMHSSGTKTLLNGTVLAAGGSPVQDMQAALDNIFHHPNVGPFIGRRLIQRLVTSNPSPAYLSRVSAAFDDNGSGVRGDMKAVIRAVLLDPEARDATRLTDGTFGKQREPVIRLANLLRATNANSANGLNGLDYLNSPDTALSQSPLLSPTVFNFFTPDYASAGPVAQAGLVAPEFQITNEVSIVGALNFFNGVIQGGSYGYGSNKLTLDYTALAAKAADPNGFADYLSLIFMNNGMTAATRATLIQAVSAIPANQANSRVKLGLMITAMAPDFVMQR